MSCDQDNLLSELEEAVDRCRIKDADLARLAEEVGATRAQELSLQAQYTAELQHIAKLRDAEVELKEEEVGCYLPGPGFGLVTLHS